MVANSFRHKKYYLIAINVGISLTMLTIVISMLYTTAFEQQRDRLIETAQSRARMIESVAQFDMKHYGDNAFEATLGQIRDAHQSFRGFGETGEFTMAKREGNKIVFLISHRHHDLNTPHPIDFKGTEAEPMRLALSGKFGSIIGRDYRGEMVLAAYEPLNVYGLGVVAKIDLSEIRTPFIQASIYAGVLSLLLIYLGSSLFVRITRDMEIELEKSEAMFRSTFANAAIGLAHINKTGQLLRSNGALTRIFGYQGHELMQRNILDIIRPEAHSELEAALQQIIDGNVELSSMELHFVKKDGSDVATNVNIARVRDPARDDTYAIIAIADISERIRLQHELECSLAEVEKQHGELKHAMETIKTISGIVPLCAWCGNTIQDESGEWVKLESYFHDHTDAEVSHGMCPSCKERFLNEKK